MASIISGKELSQQILSELQSEISTIKKELTRRLEKTIKEIEKIETQRVGSYTTEGTTA